MAKETWKKAHLESQSTSICFKGLCAISMSKNLNNNSIKEVARKTDMEKLMKEHAKKKYLCNYECIDIEPRNAFGNKRVTTSMIAYTHSFKHYSTREALINNDSKGNECPCCDWIKTWDCVIKYNKTKEIRREYVLELIAALLKIKEDRICHNEIFNMMEDVIVFLENGSFW